MKAICPFRILDFGKTLPVKTTKFYAPLRHKRGGKNFCNEIYCDTESGFESFMDKSNLNMSILYGMQLKLEVTCKGCDRVHMYARNELRTIPGMKLTVMPRIVSTSFTICNAVLQRYIEINSYFLLI